MAVFADVFPILGDLLRLGGVIVAGMLSFALSLPTIAWAWIFYRPLIGIPLLLVAAGLIVGIKMSAAKKKAAV